MPTVYAWCFSHGTLHQFNAEPWCTASWVPFAVATEEQALEAKTVAYGDAQFLDQLTADQQLEVVEICEVRTREGDAHVCDNCLGIDPDSCLYNGEKES